MKNTIKATALVGIMMLSSTFAMAEGIIVSDRTAPAPCTEKEAGIIETTGIIVSDLFSSVFGIIVSDRSEKGSTTTATCESKEGIIVSDREGIIVSDRPGIIVSD